MSHKWQQSEQKDPNIYCVCTVKGPTDQQTMCAPVVQSATQPNMTLLQKTFNKTHIYCCNFRSDTIPLSFCSITSENYDIKKNCDNSDNNDYIPLRCNFSVYQKKCSPNSLLSQYQISCCRRYIQKNKHFSATSISSMYSGLRYVQCNTTDIR